MGVDVGTATGYLDLDISGFLKGLKTAQEESQKTTENITTKIGKGFQSAGQTLTSAGSTLTKSVTTPIVGLGTAIVKVSSDFESSMSKVKAISGATGEDFDMLNAKAREMGAKTKFSASEAADAFQYMAMAGWDVENMMGGISGVMNLAAASGEDLASVSDIVTDAMTAFGLSASGTSKVLKDGVQVEVDNTTRFVDALAAASNSSNTNVSMLGESFKYVAPVAGALGYSVEDTAIALGLMANQGIKASQSGTSLRTILTNMAKPSDEVANAMTALGVSLEDDNGKVKSLMDVMKDLRKGFSGGSMDAKEFSKEMQDLQGSFDTGEISAAEYELEVENLMVAMYGAEGAQKAQYAAMLAGKTGMAGLLAIVNTGEEDFNSLADSIYNAAGTSQEMADIMNDNLSGQITIMLSALQELALQFGEILVPIIKDVVAWIQNLIAKLQEMDPEQKRQIATIAAIAAAIGPLLLVLGKLVIGVGNVITAFGNISGTIANLKSGFTLLKTAITGVSAPVLAVVAVIGTLVAAFVHLWETNEEFRNNITATWQSIKDTFGEFVSGIKERLDALGIDFETVTATISAIWEGFCELLAPVFEGALSIISSVLGGVFDAVLGVLDIFIGLFTGNWEQMWNGVQELFGGVWDAIVGIFSGAIDIIKGIVDVVLGWFGTSSESIKTSVSEFIASIIEFFVQLPQNIAQFISDAYNSVVQWGADMIAKAKEVGSNFLSSVIEFFTNLPYRVGYFIGSALGKVIAWATEMPAKAKEMATNFLTSVVTFFTQLPGKILAFISSAYDHVKKWATDMPAKAKEAATDFLNNVVDNIRSLPGKIKQFLDDAIDRLKTWVTDMGRKGREAIEELISKIMEAAKDLPSKVLTIGTDIVNGVWQGIQDAKDAFVENVKSFFKGIVDGVKEALGIKSPSKVFADEIGRWLPAGAAAGFVSAMPSAMRTIQESLNDGIDGLNVDPITIGVVNNMVTIMDTVSAYFETIEGRLAYTVASMRSNLEYLIAAGTAAANGTSIGYIGYGGMSVSNGDGSPVDNEPNAPKGGGGNTYIFYTSKPIDEIEAAKQMEKTERDMAEGFV